MSRLRDEINTYLSVPGAMCMVAAGWLWLAANHVNEEARRVSQAYVLDSLSGNKRCCISLFVRLGMLALQLPQPGRNGRVLAQQQMVCSPSLLCCPADARKLERLLPMLVALRGRVESNDPKKCELSDRKAVIHEVNIQYQSWYAARQFSPPACISKCYAWVGQCLGKAALQGER